MVQEDRGEEDGHPDYANEGKADDKEKELAALLSPELVEIAARRVLI